MNRLAPLLSLVAAVLLNESLARIAGTRQYTGLLLLIAIDAAALLGASPMLIAVAALASAYLALSLAASDLPQLTWASFAIAANVATLWWLKRPVEVALTRPEDHATTLSGRLLRMQDDEKRATARQLHDTSAQNLAALSMTLSLLKTATSGNPHVQGLLTECSDLTSGTLREIRALSYSMHPPLLDELGLETALRTYLEGIREQVGGQVELEMPRDLTALSNQSQLAIFRMIQERLAFLCRQTDELVLRIRFAEDSGQTLVEISDSMAPLHHGNIDPDSEAGLSMMALHERAKQVPCALEIESKPTGTTIRARIAQIDHRELPNIDRGRS